MVVVLMPFDPPEVISRAIKSIIQKKLYVGIDDISNLVVIALPLAKERGDYPVGDRRRVDSMMLLYYPLIIFVDFKSGYDIREDQHLDFLDYADILIYIVERRELAERIGNQLYEINSRVSGKSKRDLLERVVIYSIENEQFYTIQRSAEESSIALIVKENRERVLKEIVRKILDKYLERTLGIDKKIVHTDILPLDSIKVV